MKRFCHAFAILLCLIAMSGCATRIGNRTADGTYLNISGEAVNAYAGQYDETFEAGIKVLSDMELPIRRTRKGRNETVVMAGAPDGSSLRLHFINEGRNLTAVKVRTGAFGFWDQNFSYQIHAQIKKQLERRARLSPDPQAGLKATPALKGVKSEPIETKRTASDPAPHPDSAASEQSISTEADVSPSVLTATLPKREARNASSEKPSPSPLPEPEFTVYFDIDSNLPGPDEIAKLDQAVLQVVVNPMWHVALTGYAGSYENDGQAQIVSESRVLAVKFYLIGKGVDTNRIATIAHELNVSDKALGEQKHRRVEIRFFLGP